MIISNKKYGYDIELQLNLRKCNSRNVHVLDLKSRRR